MPTEERQKDPKTVRCGKLNVKNVERRKGGRMALSTRSFLGNREASLHAILCSAQDATMLMMRLAFVRDK